MAVQIDGSQGSVIATSGDYSGGVSIGGTLTYEDVTNIDAVGLITARSGIEIGASPGVGASISVDGNAVFSGITTFNSRVLIGTETEGHTSADDLTIATSGHTGLTLRSGTGSSGSIYFSDATSGGDEYNGYIIYDQNDDSFRVGTNENERLRIDSVGRSIFGNTGARPVGTATAHRLQVEAVDATAGVTVVRCNAGSTGPYLSFGKTRAGSLADNTVVQSGDSLGMIRFAGADGTDTQNVGAQIQALVDGTPGTDDMPGRLIFSTTADGANTSTERVRITSAGDMGVGDNSPDVRLHVTETINTAYSVDNATTETNNLLKLENPSTTGNAFSGMQFRIGSGADMYFGAIQQTTNHGDFYFANQNSPNAELMRIKSSGQVLLGNYFTSQEIGDYTASLQVGGTTANAACISINRWQNTAAGACLQLFKGRGTTGGSVDKGQNGDVIGSITFVQANNNNLDGQGNTARIDCNIDDAPGGGDYPGRLTFWTCPNASTTLAERMRINNAGDVMINATASTDGNTQKGLHIYADGGSMASFKRAQAGAGLRFIHVNTLSGWIEFNSNNTVSYTTSSDYRLKENNVPISDGIARVKNLKPYRFNWKSEPDVTVDGFFAHEAQEVVPESATRSKDRVVTQEDLDTGYVHAPMKVGDPIHQSMDASKLIPLLTAALKEAIGKIEVLESEVAALKA